MSFIFNIHFFPEVLVETKRAITFHFIKNYLQHQDSSNEHKNIEKYDDSTTVLPLYLLH